ncbi:hypothetical protein BKI52_07105 [marine bacterium AO1-C]|nr:hypothetical protein BKI52_07105 [marine bacterium AO1-C]
MKTQIPAIVFFLLLLIVSYACTKQSAPDPETQSTVPTIGIIKYTGPLAADGCDYVFRTSDNRDLKPLNLPTTFEQDGLAVKIEYTLSNESYSCGLMPNALQTINVTKIERQ